MATHSSIFAWRILRTEETGGLQSMGLQKSWMLKQLSTHTDRHFILDYLGGLKPYSYPKCPSKRDREIPMKRKRQGDYEAEVG